MRRKRRKAKYTWLPTEAISGETLGTTQGFILDLATGVYELPRTGVLPLVLDTPNTDLTVDPNDPRSLSDYIGSEYYLKRIVGKLHVQLTSSDESGNIDLSNMSPVWVKAGIYIARSGDAGNVNVPTGWSDNFFDSFSPLSWRSQREPWIFQRSWVLGWGGHMLGIPFAAAQDWGPTDAFARNVQRLTAYPSTNQAYNSVLDGPHIDIKTSRRIKTDERLFIGASAQWLPPGSIPTGSTQLTQVEFTYDFRVLGALRRARQSGSF